MVDGVTIKKGATIIQDSIKVVLKNILNLATEGIFFSISFYLATPWHVLRTKIWKSLLYTTDLYTSTHSSVLQVDLVAEDDEGEVVRVARRSLDKELVPPAVQVLERSCRCDVEHQHAAVGASVEGDSQRLKPLLPGCVPDLQTNFKS